MFARVASPVLCKSGMVEYESAQKALIARPREYQPGKSGGKFYRGAGVPRFNGGN